MKPRIVDAILEPETNEVIHEYKPEEVRQVISSTLQEPYWKY